MNKLFDGLFGEVGPGKCKLSMDGKTAVWSKGSYKTFDVATKTAVDCDSLVMDADGFFFVVPATTVEPGDIILVSGSPRAVIEVVSQNEIKVYNYETSTIETVVPERHIFMGNVYFYGKIVSLFNYMGGAGNLGQNYLSYMMMSKMMGGKSSTMGGMNPMMMMLMMNGTGGTNPFATMFSSLLGGATNPTTEEGK